MEGEISPLGLEWLPRVVGKTRFLPRVEMTMGAVDMTKGWALRWLEPVRDERSSDSLLSFRVEGEISPLGLEWLPRVVKKTSFLPRVEMTMGGVDMTMGWDLRS